MTRFLLAVLFLSGCVVDATEIDRASSPAHGERMEIIAERILSLEVQGCERPVPIRVLLGKPQRRDEGDWMTPYEIHGPGPEDVWSACACGVDAMQSLVLGMFVLPHELDVRIARLGRLTWDGDTDLGFVHPPR